jgi:phosphate/sulfate permease
MGGSGVSTKQKLISAYFGIGFLVAMYESMFGPDSMRGFAYNLGKGIVWPAVVFPSLGYLIGGIVIVLFVTFVALFVNPTDD